MNSQKNFRQRMAEKTAGMRSTSEVSDAELDTSTPKAPRTAPGALSALANAQIKIAELEKQVSGSNLLLVENMSPNPWQPRRRFTAEAMDELANGIREAGLIQPIIVRPDPSNPGHYQIVAGERRWRAHKMLGLTEIKAFIVDLSDAEMAIHAMMENLNREDLTDYEISLSIARIQAEFPSRTAAAEALGISKAQMSRLMSYPKLPAFIIKDLEDRPELLGANAAAAIVSAYSQNPTAAEKPLEELWIMLKQGELDQAKVAPLLIDRVTRKVQVSTRRHVRSFYAGGAKAGDIRRDASTFTIRLKTSVLTEDQEKRINEFMDSLFPTD